MFGNPYKEGMTVRHKCAYGFGLGKIKKIKGRTITIDFENGGVKEFDSKITPLEIIRGDGSLRSTSNVSHDIEKKPLQHSERTYNKYGEATFWEKKGRCDSDTIIGCQHFAFPDKNKVYSLSDLKKQPPPRRPGVYGWYFCDDLPPYVTKDRCKSIKTGIFRTKWWLLYIGKTSDLRSRVYDMHFNNKYWMEKSMSSLRLTLGCLLFKEKSLYLQKNLDPEKDYTFGQKGDQKLSHWMAEHARVTWVETANPGTMETAAIKRYTLPLNFNNNEHPLKNPLSELKGGFKKYAVGPAEKINKKQLRNAYKTFVKDCKNLRISK